MPKRNRLEKVYHNAPCKIRGFHRLISYEPSGSNILVRECIDCGMWGYDEQEMFKQFDKFIKKLMKYKPKVTKPHNTKINKPCEVSADSSQP